jgi:methyl-accepting chemotaxis protein
MPATTLSAGSILDKARIYRKAVFMGLAAIMASTAIIAYYEQGANKIMLAGITSGPELAAMTLMPYMVSAVIATLTAIGVLTILPAAKVAEPAEQIIYKLRDISDGDLTTRIKLSGDDPLKEVGIAFNAAAGNLGDRIAHWKVVNRQQWGVLCRIRQAVEDNDAEQALRFVAEMEQNWDRIAEIEQQLEC